MMVRKQILKVFTAALILIFAGCSTETNSDANNKTAVNTKEKIVDFLLVQNAESIVLGDDILRLNGYGSDVLYFSDRPDRIVGRIPTGKLLKYWSADGSTFRDDPPNAVLSIQDSNKPQDIVVVLTEPRIEGEDFVYNVKILDGDSAANGGASALFIDVVGMPLTLLSVAGVARLQDAALVVQYGVGCIKSS